MNMIKIMIEEEEQKEQILKALEDYVCDIVCIFPAECRCSDYHNNCKECIRARIEFEIQEEE